MHQVINAEEEEERNTSSSGGEGAACKKVSSSSSDGAHSLSRKRPGNDFHDYDAPSLPDPKESGDNDSPSSDSPQEGVCTDSSSGGEETASFRIGAESPQNKRKIVNTAAGVHKMARRTGPAGTTGDRSLSISNNLPPNIARSGGISHAVQVMVSSTTAAPSNAKADVQPSAESTTAFLATIAHSIESATGNAPMPMAATSAGFKPSSPRADPPVANHPSDPENDTTSCNKKEETKDGNFHHRRCGKRSVITIDNEYTTATSHGSSSSRTNDTPLVKPGNPRRCINARYHINEDDMMLTENILMCPFIFRSQEAVQCGALAECVQPGMLRATFSPTNKLRNVEMIFDAMGFCQQLERASGNEGMAQIIPNSLEMAMTAKPNSSGELAQVITLGTGPFQVVSVNESWTRLTGYTQLDVKGKDLRRVLLEGGETQRKREEKVEGLENMRTDMHDFEIVAKRGVCAASTNVHFDNMGKGFLNFMCSYPLSNLKDEITHILHVCQELPARE